MEKEIRTVQPMLGILLIYALLLLVTNLFFALQIDSHSSWEPDRLYFHETGFFMIYGIAVTISSFCLFKETDKLYWMYFVLGGFICICTVTLNDFILFKFNYSPPDYRWAYYHFPPLAIWFIITVITGNMKGYSLGLRINAKPLKPYWFIMIAIFSGGLIMLIAYWRDIYNGNMGFFWGSVILKAVELLTCCLIMYIIYKTTLTVSKTNMKPNLKSSVVLRVWFIICMLIHLRLLMTFYDLNSNDFPELEGVFFNLCILLGLCFLIFNKRIGWSLFCIPLILFFLTIVRILIYTLIKHKLEIDPLIYLFSALFLSILAFELIIAWYFVKRKQINR